MMGKQDEEDSQVAQPQDGEDSQVAQPQDVEDTQVAQPQDGDDSQVAQPQDGEDSQVPQPQDGENSREQQAHTIKELLDLLQTTVSSMEYMWQILDSVRQQRRQTKGGKVFSKVIAWCLVVGVGLAPIAAFLQYGYFISSRLHGIVSL